MPKKSREQQLIEKLAAKLIEQKLQPSSYTKKKAKRAIRGTVGRVAFERLIDSTPNKRIVRAMKAAKK